MHPLLVIYGRYTIQHGSYMQLYLDLVVAAPFGLALGATSGKRPHVGISFWHWREALIRGS